jgi:membrane protein required for colicin V production
MSFLDYLILGIFSLSIIYSFARGAVREIFSLLALIAGYMVASRVYGYGTPYLERFISDSRLAGVISFIAVFLTVGLLVGIVGRILHVATKRVHLSFPNRLVGALFGFVKGVVFVSILLLVIPYFSDSASRGQLLKDSALAPFFAAATEAISSAFPTRKYGALDNRLTREFRAIREKTGQGLWSDISRRLNGKSDTKLSDSGQTEEEEREIQKLLKKKQP